MATDYGLMTMMQYGCIRIFSGNQPGSADMPEQGELLGEITQNGAPFQWGTTQGALSLGYGQLLGSCQMVGDWKLTAKKSGVAGWWRFVGNAYDGGTDQEFTPRIDGRINEGLMLPSTSLTSGDVLTVQSFVFSLGN